MKSNVLTKAQVSHSILYSRALLKPTDSSSFISVRLSILLLENWKKRNLFQNCSLISLPVTDDYVEFLEELGVTLIEHLTLA